METTSQLQWWRCGLIGGTVQDSNLIFNSCRESGDHGPFKFVTLLPADSADRSVP